MRHGVEVQTTWEGPTETLELEAGVYTYLEVITF